MTEFMNNTTAFFNSGLGSVIKAILLLILAFIVAALAKSLILKLLSKTKLAETNPSLSADGSTGSSAAELIAKLAQLVVFLLFIPGIFELLGMTQVSTPILTMLTTLWGFVPNIVGCVIILWVGFYVARLVRELLIPALNKLEVNKLQNMAGLKVSDAGKLSNTLAYIVYVLILIPVIIAALYALDIRAISDPAIAMLSLILNYIPNILAALIIISIGYVLARFIGNIVTRLIAASGLDAKIADLMDNKNSKFVLSNVCGKTVEVVLVIFFVVESLATLHLGVLTRIGVAIIGYMPEVLLAFIIAIICMFLAGTVYTAMKKNGHAKSGLALKYLIYVVGVFMILNSLHVAPVLVDSAFIIIVAAIGVAFAIAYGIGGREFARNSLAVLEKKLGLNNKTEE